MLKLIINDVEITAEEGLTILQACEMAGHEIPKFCYHNKLKIAGNCRMCLVEIDKFPKPVASCAMPISQGMIIHTNSQKIQKARQGVMEFLLINHPLDCPVCDRGGECDLQDQAFKYGSGTNRFIDNKRSVKDKYMGPLIKTHMTRCIYCTRCIRFATDVAGIEEMGALYRGELTEVTSYLEKTVSSELSGNMIDICPVGALTSKPYASRARNWELEKTESIDVLDAIGSNIIINNKGLEVMRILPRINEEINEEWISDKARFAYDGLKNMRLDRPYVKKAGKLVQCSWSEAIETVAQKIRSLSGSEIAAIAGTLACTESMFILKQLLSVLNCSNIDANQFGYKIDSSLRANYLFNATISGIEGADLCLIIGADPRRAAPVLNARIGKMQRQGKLEVARIGAINDQTYQIQELGDSVEILKDIMSGNHEFVEHIKTAKRPMIIVGDGILSRNDGLALLSLINDIATKYEASFNMLHNHASMVGSLDIGFKPGPDSKDIIEIIKGAKAGTIKLVYLLAADEIDMASLEKTFVIYQGHHGDLGANIADVILPGAAYTEKDAMYVNIEGRVQLARAAVLPPGQAKEDWLIIKNLADELKIDLGIENLAQLRNELAKFSPVFSDISTIVTGLPNITHSQDDIINTPIKLIDTNYYMTDSVSRASLNMAKCTKEKNVTEQVA
ncbi:MAG: NADH-quinone oxidoreductase subunit G [Rickettsiaceae bacterium]|nr:MAG: NADH-quinone oxidoreductase subunit G [Rickettsiaceae bacterium]